MLSFQTLCSRFNLPTTSHFLYLQLRSALRTYGVQTNSKLQTHPIVAWLSTTNTRGLVSAVYSQLQTRTQQELPLARVWSRDLAVAEEDINWKNVWENALHASKNPNHQLIHYKLCQKAYSTPLLRFRMKLSTSPNCNLCSLNTLGTFKHMIWDCPEVFGFWRKVTVTLSSMIDKPIPLEPTLLLLNDDSHLGLNEKQRKVWLAGLTAAKKLVVQRWLPPHKLYARKWLEYFQDVVMLELSTARLNKAQISTLDSWKRAALAITDLLSSE